MNINTKVFATADFADVVLNYANIEAEHRMTLERSGEFYVIAHNDKHGRTVCHMSEADFYLIEDRYFS